MGGGGGGSGKVSNYMLPLKMLNVKYQERHFTIHSSKRPLTSILDFYSLLNYKNTVAFYQQSSHEYSEEGSKYRVESSIKVYFNPENFN